MLAIPTPINIAAATHTTQSIGDAPLSLPQLIQQALNDFTNHPAPTLIRAGITVITLLIALTLSRWLAGIVERVPVRVETRLTRAGRKVAPEVVEERAGLSEWLGRLTAVCVWIAAAVAIGFIWFNTGAPSGNDVGTTAANFGKLLGESVIIIAITLGAASALQRTVSASLAHNKVNKNLTLLGGRLIYLTALVVGFVVLLSLWGTGIVVPVALLGALTVALSLALQGVLTNLVSGVYLLLERPFVIGDQITLNTFTGDVEDIQIRYTALRTPDGLRVIIPNSMLFNSAVVNLSHYQNRRGALVVILADTSPQAIDHAEEQIGVALRAVPDVLSAPQPQIILNSIAADKAELHIIFWIARSAFGQNSAVSSQLIEEVRARLGDAEVALLDPATTASAV